MRFQLSIPDYHRPATRRLSLLNKLRVWEPCPPWFLISNCWSAATLAHPKVENQFDPASCRVLHAIPPLIRELPLGYELFGRISPKTLQSMRVLSFLKPRMPMGPGSIVSNEKCLHRYFSGRVGFLFLGTVKSGKLVIFLWIMQGCCSPAWSSEAARLDSIPRLDCCKLHWVFFFLDPLALQQLEYDSHKFFCYLTHQHSVYHD